MDIAILLFEGLTALDAVGPYEVLWRVPGARVHWVATSCGVHRTESGFGMLADRTLDEIQHPDVLVIPGGIGARTAMRDPIILNWVRAAHAESQWTTSVCTGALVLGAAGILNGLKATTHWSELDRLREFGAEPTTARVVTQDKVITAAGVSAGIDMALELARLLSSEVVAQAIQLSIEYDPQPPFDCGSVNKAKPEVVSLVRGAISRVQSKDSAV
jgi:transcriptional regulator GlxA family with amidase domain